MVFTVKEVTVLKFKLIGTSFKSKSDMFFVFFYSGDSLRCFEKYGSFILEYVCSIVEDI